MKRAFGSNDLVQALAIVILLFTPLIGGHLWWSLIVVGVLIILTIGHVRKRTPRLVK